jgi:hypothetical protein
MADGRALLRSTLAAALEGRIAADEQKGAWPGNAGKRTAGTPKAATCERS